MWLRALWSVLSVRSGKWPAVRAAHLKREPECQACLRTKELEVHHIRPVHTGGPELDDSNLITLCHDCHFTVGHGCNWKHWRPEVKDICATLRAGIRRTL